MKEDITICEVCNNDTKLCTCKGVKEITEKPFEEKNIVERHTMSDGRFNLAGCLLEQEAINKDLITKVAALEEAMIFFSNWYNKTQEPNILVPEGFNTDKPKIIL